MSEPTYRVTVTTTDHVTVRVVEGLSYHDARALYHGWISGINLRIYDRATGVTIIQEGQDVVEDGDNIVAAAMCWGIHKDDPV